MAPAEAARAAALRRRGERRAQELARRAGPTLEVGARKGEKKRTRSGFPAQSYQSLLRELATLQRGRLRVVANKTIKANVAFLPTPLQAEAYRLVGVRLSNRTQ